MEDAVRAVDLSKTYGTGLTAVRALDHVTLTIARGTVAALLGPSGSGKSTLIKALGFVSPADTGEVFFEGRLVVKDGVPLADLAALHRRHLGFVFQKANVAAAGEAGVGRGSRAATRTDTLSCRSTARCYHWCRMSTIGG